MQEVSVELNTQELESAVLSRHSEQSHACFGPAVIRTPMWMLWNSRDKKIIIIKNKRLLALSDFAIKLGLAKCHIMSQTEIVPASFGSFGFWGRR